MIPSRRGEAAQGDMDTLITPPAMLVVMEHNSSVAIFTHRSFAQ
ncbi:MAG: hypothetical protein PVG60_04770 [Desulfarculaceae bacterium]